MNSSQQTANKPQASSSNPAAAADSSVVLVREAGVPYQPNLANSDSIVEWISLMEVVQMLCPVWSVRDKPMLGTQWKL